MTRRPRTLLLLAALAALTSGCHRPAPGTPRSVLLVTLDTVRADRLGHHGRKDAGTPGLDALAARGTAFTDATAAGPVTLPSHATILTGLDPSRHGVRHNGLFALAPEAVTLAERLRDAGFATGAFVGSLVLDRRHGLDQGFEAYTAPGASAAAATFFLPERAGSAVNADALAWLDGVAREKPFFAWVHYMEAHAPYAPPALERNRHPGDPYQAEIAACDRFLRELLDGLAARGRLEETLVIVTADHGEDLGDHGEGTHGIFLYQSTLHVPLAMAGPGVKQGHRVEEPVGGADVAPTVLEALQLPPLEPCDGRSLWGAASRGDRLPPDRPLYAETFMTRYDYGWSELRALRQGPWKYVQAPRPELYDLEADPFERSSRALAESSRAELLHEALDVRVRRAVEEGIASERVNLSEADLEALRSLGYLAGAGAADAGGDLPDPKDRVADALALDAADERLRAGAVAQAVRELRELVDRAPGFLEARVSLVVALATSGDLRAAEGEARALLERASAQPEGRQLAAKGSLLLGGLLEQQGRAAEACDAVEGAFAVPQPPELYLQHARTCRAAGRVDVARARLSELVARPDAPPEAAALLAELGAPPR